MILSSIIAATILAQAPPDFINPILPIPDSLEICILKAELCAARAYEPLCSELNNDAIQDCVEDYEDCTANIPEAHISGSCRIDEVWCVLESPFWIENDLIPEWVKYCSWVEQSCPALAP